MGSRIRLEIARIIYDGRGRVDRPVGSVRTNAGQLPYPDPNGALVAMRRSALRASAQSQIRFSHTALRDCRITEHLVTPTGPVSRIRAG